MLLESFSWVLGDHTSRNLWPNPASWKSWPPSDLSRSLNSNTATGKHAHPAVQTGFPVCAVGDVSTGDRKLIIAQTKAA